MKILLKIKPVTIILLLITLSITPIGLSFLLRKDIFLFSYFSVILVTLFIICYLWTMAFYLRQLAIKKDLNISNKLYATMNVCLLYSLCYAVVFCFAQLEPIVLMPAHLLAMTSMGFSLFFIFRVFISIERASLMSNKDTYKELRSFSKSNRKMNGIQIWDIQKRINKIFEGNL